MYTYVTEQLLIVTSVVPIRASMTIQKTNYIIPWLINTHKENQREICHCYQREGGTDGRGKCSSRSSGTPEMDKTI